MAWQSDFNFGVFPLGKIIQCNTDLIGFLADFGTGSGCQNKDADCAVGEILLVFQITISSDDNCILIQLGYLQEFAVLKCCPTSLCCCVHSMGMKKTPKRNRRVLVTIKLL